MAIRVKGCGMVVALSQVAPPLSLLRLACEANLLVISGGGDFYN